jgi:hypothetical protein
VPVTGPIAGASHIYEVRAESSNGQVRAFGARRTRREAEDLLRESKRRVKAASGRNQRYWIEEIDTAGLWQPPPQPKPRDRYTTRVTTTKLPGRWETVHVEVLDGDAVIAGYDRNYRMLQTFEPFRQGDRMFALISTHYTATSVMDLHTGDIIAAGEPASGGSARSGSTSRTGGTSTTARSYPARCTGARPTTSGLLPAISASSGAASGATTRPGKSSTLTCPRSQTA